MKESYEKDVASHLGPESCAAVRKDSREVLIGENAGEPLSREIKIPELPTLLSEAEGHSVHDDNRKPCITPCAVVDPEHAGKSTVRKLGDLIRVWS